MTIQGLRTDENFVTNQRPQNWREAILLLYPNGKAPLTALSSMMKSESTDDPVFNWWDKILNARRIALTADITNVATTFTVGQTGGVNNALIAGIRNNHILRLEHTGELVRVTADPVSGASTITVTRNMGSVAGTAITVASANPNMHVVSTGMPENSQPPTGVNYDPNQRFNYTQIFRNTLQMSRTAQKTRLRTGDQLAEAKRECLEYHSIDIEWASFFGELSIITDAQTGNPLRYTSGVIRQINDGASSNIVDDNGANLTMTLLEQHMEQAFRFGSSEKLAFCGNAALLNIQVCIRKNTTYNLYANEKEYGMKVMRLVSPFGELVLKTHPLFNQITAANSQLALNDWLVVLDPQEIRYRYLKDSDTQYQPDTRSTNGQDGLQSGYLTECGYELHHPLAHCVFKRLGPGTNG